MSKKVTHPNRKGKKGRRSIGELPKEEVKAEIVEFLDDLRKATDPDDKKRIRRSLRRRGHRGGLGEK